MEADLEILQLALDCLKAAQQPTFTVDLADVRIVSALLAGVKLSAETLDQIQASLAVKDATGLAHLTRDFPVVSRQGLLALLQLYGDASVLAEAQKVLPPMPAVREALRSLSWLAKHLSGVSLSFDLADLRGYAYYSGVRFAVYAPGASDALLRGGRYDEVGAVFGRKRPAVGFSLDIKNLVQVVSPRALRAAIRAPWGEAADLHRAIAALRAQGETVVCVLPGHESEVDEFHCDRELRCVSGQWVVSIL